MTDDPRQILAEAGVECAEVGEFSNFKEWHDFGRTLEDVYEEADRSILALARLVAKYKTELGRFMATDVSYDKLADATFTSDMGKRYTMKELNDICQLFETGLAEAVQNKVDELFPSLKSARQP